MLAITSIDEKIKTKKVGEILTNIIFVDISQNVYMECKEGSSNKFYRIEVSGLEVITHHGPITGKPGIKGIKTFESEEEAHAFAVKTQKEKANKGYVVTTEEGSEDGGKVKKEVKAAQKKPRKAAASSLPKKKAGATSEAIDVKTDEGSFYLECKEGTSNKFYRITVSKIFTWLSDISDAHSCRLRVVHL